MHYEAEVIRYGSKLSIAKFSRNWNKFTGAGALNFDSFKKLQLHNIYFDPVVNFKGCDSVLLFLVYFWLLFN